MNDNLLKLADTLNVDLSNTANVVDLTGFGGLITFISDSIPMLEATTYGNERMALEVVCASAFADSCNVTMELISYSAGDLTSIGTALVLGGYSSHWIAPTIPNTLFTTGKRMATIPLPPGKEIQAYLALILRFSAETAGRITANITYPTTRVQYPAPNAI